MTTNVIQQWRRQAEDPRRKLRVPDKNGRVAAIFNPATLELVIPHRNEDYYFDLGQMVNEHVERKVRLVEHAC